MVKSCHLAEFEVFQEAWFPPGKQITKSECVTYTMVSFYLLHFILVHILEIVFKVF